MLDLLRKDFRSEIFRFRVRRRKNSEAYTEYMLKNFYKAVVEIWRLQQKSLYAVGLLYVLRACRIAAIALRCKRSDLTVYAGSSPAAPI